MSRTREHVSRNPHFRLPFPLKRMSPRLIPVCFIKIAFSFDQYTVTVIFIANLVGVFRCGPASVKAVKQGAVYLPYDTSFVFAEVNGDRVFWEVQENGPMKVIRVDKKCIGKMISTKAVGSDDRDDITLEYKHPEGKSNELRVEC